MVDKSWLMYENVNKIEESVDKFKHVSART